MWTRLQDGLNAFRHQCCEPKLPHTHRVIMVSLYKVTVFLELYLFFIMCHRIKLKYFMIQTFFPRAELVSPTSLFSDHLLLSRILQKQLNRHSVKHIWSKLILVGLVPAAHDHSKHLNCNCAIKSHKRRLPPKLWEAASNDRIQQNCRGWKWLSQAFMFTTDCSKIKAVACLTVSTHRSQMQHCAFLFSLENISQYFYTDPNQ